MTALLSTLDQMAFLLICMLVGFFSQQTHLLPSDAQILILIFTALPLGLNTIVFPAAYGGDETPGASMAVISNVIGIVTVPIILSLVL